jgi:3-methyladenine DNA glycosylase Tag
VTPKRKRMVNVLDVLETIKSSSSTLKKVAEAQKAQIETTAAGTETTKHQAKIETGPSESAKEKSLETEGENTKETLKQILTNKTLSSTPEASSKLPIILYDMLRVKCYLKRKSEKLIIMPRN